MDMENTEEVRKGFRQTDCGRLCDFPILSDSQIHVCVLYLQQTLCRVLGLAPPEIQQLQSSLAKYAGSSTTAAPRVRFKTDADMNVVDFLGCFQCHLQREEKDSAATTLTVQLCSGLSESKLSRLGKKCKSRDRAMFMLSCS